MMEYCNHCRRPLDKQIDGTCGTCGKKQTDEVLRNKYRNTPDIKPIPRKPPPVDVSALQAKLSRYQSVLFEIAKGRVNGSKALPAPTSRKLALSALENEGVSY